MPYVHMKYRLCNKCHVRGGYFWAQTREDRPTKLNIHAICRKCKREEVKDSYYRCSEGKCKRYEKSIESMYQTEVV